MSREPATPDSQEEKRVKKERHKTERKELGPLRSSRANSPVGDTLERSPCVLSEVDKAALCLCENLSQEVAL